MRKKSDERNNVSIILVTEGLWENEQFSLHSYSISAVEAKACAQHKQIYAVIKKNPIWYVSAVERLPSMCKALGLFSSIEKKVIFI
jgi:hypothetical protein